MLLDDVLYAVGHISLPLGQIHPEHATQQIHQIVGDKENPLTL